MHVGRRYKTSEFLIWTGWEAVYLILWALAVTMFLQLTHWDFLTIPAPILTIVGSALAIILAFKNSQCYARFNEALTTASQLISNSLIFRNRVRSIVAGLDPAQSGPQRMETVDGEFLAGYVKGNFEKATGCAPSYRRGAADYGARNWAVLKACGLRPHRNNSEK